MAERWDETYNEAWKVYDRFSECEDYEDSAFTVLQKYIKFESKTVYEYGCGTGKYTEKISDLCHKLYANDISPLMTEKAQERCACKTNIEYITASAEHSGLADESVDIIFGAWAGPPFNEKDIIGRIEKEFTRILKKDGSIWIFANYLKGEFTKMRGIQEPSDPAAYFLNELGVYGYKLIEVVPAYWKFPDLEEAKNVCSFIFGDNAIAFFDKKGCPVMEDNIAVFSRTK